MLKKISERIYYMPHEDKTDRPVLGLICGDKYSLIVDAGNSPNHAMEFLLNIAELKVAPSQISSNYTLALGSYIWELTQ